MPAWNWARHGICMKTFASYWKEIVVRPDWP